MLIALGDLLTFYTKVAEILYEISEQVGVVHSCDLRAYAHTLVLDHSTAFNFS